MTLASSCEPCDIVPRMSFDKRFQARLNSTPATVQAVPSVTPGATPPLARSPGPVPGVKKRMMRLSPANTLLTGVSIDTGELERRLVPLQRLYVANPTPHGCAHLILAF